jgi:hypothetical protein
MRLEGLRKLKKSNDLIRDMPISNFGLETDYPD